MSALPLESANYPSPSVHQEEKNQSQKNATATNKQNTIISKAIIFIIHINKASCTSL